MARLDTDVSFMLKVDSSEFLTCEKIRTLFELCANLTFTQALYRALGPGESRATLVSKCIAGCKKQNMKPSKHLAKLADEHAGSEEPKASEAPAPLLLRSRARGLPAPSAEAEAEAADGPPSKRQRQRMTTPGPKVLAAKDTPI